MEEVSLTDEQGTVNDRILQTCLGKVTEQFTAILGPSTLPTLLKTVLEVVEQTQLQGGSRKALALCLMREIVSAAVSWWID